MCAIYRYMEQLSHVIAKYQNDIAHANVVYMQTLCRCSGYDVITSPGWRRGACRHMLYVRRIYCGVVTSCAVVTSRDRHAQWRHFFVKILTISSQPLRWRCFFSCCDVARSALETSRLTIVTSFLPPSHRSKFLPLLWRHCFSSAAQTCCGQPVLPRDGRSSARDPHAFSISCRTTKHNVYSLSEDNNYICINSANIIEGKFCK